MAFSQTRSKGLPLMNLLRLKGESILQQLHLEERLLRTSTDNWCIVNDGTVDPTIVMAISGKPAELVETSVLRDGIPVVRRFTGGGTVIVDQGTVFVTFICNNDAVPGLQSYPHPIMSWSSLIYKDVFQGIGEFNLRENGAEARIGGNAQSITRSSWIHHTSFLWDYETKNMGYLKHPKRAPDYRKSRDHLEFISRMKDHIPRQTFIDRIIDALENHFELSSSHQEMSHSSPFVPSSRLLTMHELEEAILKSKRDCIGNIYAMIGR